MVLDVTSINFSKDNLHSEDAVLHEVINEQYVTFINSDGNGSAGKRSQKVLHKFDNDNLELASIIAVTTNYYTNRIFKSIVNDLKFNKFSIERASRRIEHIIINEIKLDKRLVYFCFLLSVIDLKNKKLYSIGVGDCLYTVFDLKNGTMETNTLQKTQSLAFNGRGSALVGCPISIHNTSSYLYPINVKVSNIPDKFIFLQYSDGLGYDIAVPIHIIENELKRTITWDDESLTDDNIIKTHKKIEEKILKKDKPDSSYSRYNITKNEMYKVLSNNKSTTKIILELIKCTEYAPDNRRKNDDISLVVFYHNPVF
uniref:PPM-type phosphatase domain-containing protein n=1 Tax=viral metagenome TaxID=1070528 RepID=A0A6C0LJ98_9ZZZZ